MRMVAGVGMLGLGVMRQLVGEARRLVLAGVRRRRWRASVGDCRAAREGDEPQREQTQQHDGGGCNRVQKRLVNESPVRISGGLEFGPRSLRPRGDHSGQQVSVIPAYPSLYLRCSDATDKPSLQHSGALKTFEPATR